jgi:hypothetical protein
MPFLISRRVRIQIQKTRSRRNFSTVKEFPALQQKLPSALESSICDDDYASNKSASRRQIDKRTKERAALSLATSPVPPIPTYPPRHMLPSNDCSNVYLVSLSNLLQKATRREPHLRSQVEREYRMREGEKQCVLGALAVG